MLSVQLIARLQNKITTHHDPENEADVQKTINAFIKGRTVIAITHRLKTIRHADHIIVLHDGRVAETGAHNELLRTNGLYARLWHIQESASGWTL